MKQNKRLLVIVPHPDDELNISGQLIASLDNIEIVLLIVTNGDYIKKDTFRRLNECIEAVGVLGVKTENIHFLGYGNEYKNEKNFLESNRDDIIESVSGHFETYSIPDKPELPYILHGNHSQYTTLNYKRDLRDAILYFRADYILLNDLDEHIDHIVLTLSFDNVMNEILNENNNYTPIVLKKYAYASCWYGKNDYYSYSATLDDQNALNKELKWDERITFFPIDKAFTPLLHNNIVYKAAKKYKTQCAQTRMGRVCNSDIVYWQYRTDNLIHGAQIFVSSGDEGILKESFGCQYGFKNGELSPRRNYFSFEPNDDERCITIHFHSPQSIKRIKVLPEKNDCGCCNEYKDITVSINGQVEKTYAALCEEGVDYCNVSTLVFRFLTNAPCPFQIGIYPSLKQVLDLTYANGSQNINKPMSIFTIKEILIDRISEFLFRIKMMLLKTKQEGLLYYPKKLFKKITK